MTDAMFLRGAAAAPGATAASPAAMRRRSVLLCGVGSVGRPVATRLPTLGVTHLTVVDPKYYVARSVESQCAPEDIYHRKVAVVAKLARQTGMTVIARADDICCLPDGILPEGALLISCTDNTRALIRANRIAARMQSPLLKINIEPLLNCVSVRAYRACGESTPCAECQLSDRHYEQQTHPHSCDAPRSSRRTAGSRELAAAAAELTWRAARDILDAGDAADRWFAWETQARLGSDRLTRSRLERYEHCRWDHSARWPNVFRLTESPRDLRLAQLIPWPYRSSLAEVVFDFDRAVTRWGCCNRCPRRVRRTQWLGSQADSVGNCPVCGGWLAAFPFGVRQRLTGRDLRDVLPLPLADWGVAPGAVIQVTTGQHVRTFVVGGTESSQPEL